MNAEQIVYKPIGILHSEHTVLVQTPAQPVYAEECRGVVEIFPDFADGLKHIEGFSHIYLIYHLHKASPAQLLVEPFLQKAEHGIFATRAPCRPNPVGLSIVELVQREQNALIIRGVDILDGTPILDIKPYSSRFDQIVPRQSGWMDVLDDETAWQRGRRGFKPAA